MAFCTYESSLDYCLSYGPDHGTRGHGGCYTGIPDIVDHGQGNAMGCDVGCAPCMDNPLRFFRDANIPDGKRWLRALEIPTARDARGVIHDVRANERHPVGKAISLQSAPSWKNGGTECWGESVCYAWPSPNHFCWKEYDYLPCQCADGEDLAEEISSDRLIPDTLSFGGYVLGGDIYCRKFWQANDRDLNLAAAEYGIPGFLAPIRRRSSTFDAEYGYAACVPNILTPCTGKVVGSECESGLDNLYGGGPTHYMENEGVRNSFNYLRLFYEDVRIDREGPEYEIANQALALMTTTTFSDGSQQGVNFDQLDHRNDDGNGWVGFWSRGFNYPGEPQYYTNPEALVATFENCRLRAHGCEVVVKVYIARVSVSVLLVPETLTDRPETSLDPAVRHVEIDARARIDIDLFVYAQATGDCPVNISNTVDVRGSANTLPTADGDWIQYQTNNGVRFRPPLRVRWEGFLGGHSRPSTARLLDLTAYGTNDQECTWFTGNVNWHESGASERRGLYIPGWPYAAGSTPDDPATVYQGGLVCTFE